MKLDELLKQIMPLPYTAFRRFTASGEDNGAIIHGESTTVAEVRATEPMALATMNAAYLAHSANMLPKLVEALGPLEKLYRGQLTNTGEYYPQLFNVASAALAEAQEVNP